MSTPWIVYSQTTMPAQGSVNNPAPNVNGLNGEVTSLPYTVPTGYNLVLTGWGFEGLNTPFGVCIPWIGTGAVTNAKCLASVGPSRASYYATGMIWSIPAGKVVNVYLLNGTNEANVVCSWFVQGYLEPIVLI